MTVTMEEIKQVLKYFKVPPTTPWGPPICFNDDFRDRED